VRQPHQEELDMEASCCIDEVQRDQIEKFAAYKLKPVQEVSKRTRVATLSQPMDAFLGSKFLCLTLGLCFVYLLSTIIFLDHQLLLVFFQSHGSLACQREKRNNVHCHY
jgi:hypothetical protein